jgi:hypothetical protein
MGQRRSLLAGTVPFYLGTITPVRDPGVTREVTPG